MFAWIALVEFIELSLYEYSLVTQSIYSCTGKCCFCEGWEEANISRYHQVPFTGNLLLKKWEISNKRVETLLCEIKWLKWRVKAYQSSKILYTSINDLKWVQGSEDQLRYPCCLALVSQALELLPWLPRTWFHALYSSHLIRCFEWHMNEWLIEERHVSVCLFYLLAISHKCCVKKLFCGRC